MSAPRWWGKVACWLAGGQHNLTGVELPPGWTTQTCRTCGVPVQVFGRGTRSTSRHQETRPASEETS